MDPTTADAGDISVVAGAICDEKQMITSDVISIDARPVTLRGADKTYDLKILYSTAGFVTYDCCSGIFGNFLSIWAGPR